MSHYSPSTTVGPDEVLEDVQRLADDLRHVKQRWSNRLILENRSLWKGYFNGNFEIALYGEAIVGGEDKVLWVVRIPAQKTTDSIRPDSDDGCFYLAEGNDWNKVVMFVVVTQARGGPEVKVRVPARFYIFRDEVRSVGEGLMYRTKGFGGFKVFPFLREGEVKSPFWSDTESSGVDPDVQAFPEVVDSIAGDCAKMLRDRVFGVVGEPITIWLSQDCYTPMRHPKVIKPLWQSSLLCDNFVNVAIGPLDL